MKNLALSFLLLGVIFSASAQEINYTVAFKGYLSFIADQNGGWINGNYAYSYFHVGDPGFAVSFIRTKGNYHQLELSDLAFNIYESRSGFENGKITNVMLGLRYGYYICLLRSSNGKLKTLIAPAVHLVVNDHIFNPHISTQYPNRYSTYIGDVEVIPAITYQITRHFSIEANVPITLIGLSEEFTHLLNPTVSTTDQRYWQHEAFLGPQYFQGRVGVAFNL